MPEHFKPFLFGCQGMKKLIFFIAGIAFAQTPVQIQNPCLQAACFWATQSATVASSSSIVLTIQQPATGARQVSFQQAIVQCPGQSFTISQAQNGAAATATAGSASALLPIQYINNGSTAVTAAALVFTSSNVGTGTATSPIQTYPSGGSPPVLDLSNRTMGIPPTGSFNYSVTLTNTGGSSCTGTIGIYWSEKI
jgi:hypothetical protein